LIINDYFLAHFPNSSPSMANSNPQRGHVWTLAGSTMAIWKIIIAISMAIVTTACNDANAPHPTSTKTYYKNSSNWAINQ